MNRLLSTYITSAPITKSIMDTDNKYGVALPKNKLSSDVRKRKKATSLRE